MKGDGVREVIDQASNDAKAYVASAFAGTAHIGPGGFEGFMAAAISSYKKELKLGETLRKVAKKATEETGHKFCPPPEAMRALVYMRTFVAMLRQETERLS